MSLYVEGVLVVVCINIILGLGYWITVNAGQFSFGHAGFVAIGAYTSSILTLNFGVPLIPAVVAAGVVTGVVGGLLAFPVLRLSMLYLAMATLGFAQLVQIGFLNWTYVGRATGMQGMRGTSLELVIVVLVLVIVYLWLMTRSRVGLAFEAVREDEAAARAAGLDVTRIKVSAFGQSALVTGMAGALYAHHQFYIEPALFGVHQSLVIVLYVMLGGMYSMWGPIFGATVLTLLPEVFEFLREWYLIIYGGLYVVLMIVRPQGLIGRGGFMGGLDGMRRTWQAIRGGTKPPAEPVVTKEAAVGRGDLTG